jgi:ppGpp synthetase/RelA/SpoT-type nucleotidyltranferase
MTLDRPDVQTNARRFLEIAGQLLRDRLRTHHVVIPPEWLVAWRVKSPEAIARKLQSPMHRQAGINDFIGMRIIADTLHRLPSFEREVRHWAEAVGLTMPEAVESTFESPKRIGYRSIHFDYRFRDPASWSLPVEASVEVQLTTWIQFLQGALSHRLVYEARQPVPYLVANALEQTSASLWRADCEVSEILRGLPDDHV